MNYAGKRKAAEKMRVHLNIRFKIMLQIAADMLSVFGAYLCSLLLRFGGAIPPEHISAFLNTIIPIIVVHIVLYYFLGLYRSLWETASIDELIKVVVGTAIASVVSFFLMRLIVQRSMPDSIYIAAGLIIMMLAGFTRLSYRIFRRLFHAIPTTDIKRAMIFGAGETGSLIARQLIETRAFGMLPVVLVDDDEAKRSMFIRGIKVAGNRHDIVRLADQYEVDVIIFCAPSIAAEDRREILQICFETGCTVKTVPGIKEILNNGTIATMRDIEMADLLSRPEVELDTVGISGYLSGASVLVTGGGGSIGSELCRQIAHFSPKKIIIFDIYENNAYELLIEMRQRFPEIDTEVEIGSIREMQRLDELFMKHRPNVVFHAAAHKHVPLMEANPAEAIKNNVFGTWNVAQMADKYCVDRFVLISTDKAVNPTNVMGATKRLAEYVAQYMNTVSKTQFVSVRFGNVLGSNGSVIPLFKKQIAQGGPVTVTHKDMTRYFMTIPEAARLVLQAGSLADRGELFILDMGEPVRIDDVAKTLIRLSGLRPDIDIKIEYIGLRPGEKLHEELFLQEEKVATTDVPGVYIGSNHQQIHKSIKQELEWLGQQIKDNEADIRQCLASIVKTYRCNGAEHEEQTPLAYEEVSADCENRQRDL